MLLVVGGTGSIGELSSVEEYSQVDNVWLSRPSISGARTQAARVLLDDGRVMVCGGVDAGTYLTSVEIWDPDSRTWTTVTAMPTARSKHVAVTLPSGLVLVAAGFNGSGYLATAEVYDPEDDDWFSIGSMATARRSPAAVTIERGFVLVIGGENGSGASNKVDRLNPANLTWSALADMATARRDHAAVRLNSNKVLVIGGRDGAVLSSCELFDPDLGTWAVTGSLATARKLHAAAMLPNDRVLACGGEGPASLLLASAERYNPVTELWSASGSMVGARKSHGLVALEDDFVMAVGGENGSGAMASTSLYFVGTETWSAGPAMAAARFSHVTIWEPAADPDVLLPLAFVDDIVESSVDMLLANRNPEPGQVAVSHLTNIVVEIMASIAMVDISLSTVKVNGILAYDGGSGTPFKPGFDGAGSLATTRDSGRTLRLVIDPTTYELESGSTVVVRVESQTVGGGAFIDESYSFEIEDWRQPRLVYDPSSTKWSSRRRVRAEFDEGMKSSDPTAADDALNPANWALVQLAAPDAFLPVAGVEVVSVERLSGQAFLLTTDVEMTYAKQGDVYREDVLVATTTAVTGVVETALGQHLDDAAVGIVKPGDSAVIAGSAADGEYVVLEVLSSREFRVTSPILNSSGGYVSFRRQACYRLQVENVADLAGNVVDPAYDMAIVLGREPGHAEGERDFELIKHLQKQIVAMDETGELRNFIASLQEIEDVLLVEMDFMNTIYDYDIVDARFLDLFLAHLGNPFQFELSDIKKRALIRSLVVAYKRKGTNDGILQLVTFFLGYDASIKTLYDDVMRLGISHLGVDWRLGPGDPGAPWSFFVELSSADFLDLMANPESDGTSAKEKVMDFIVTWCMPAHTHFLGAREEP